MITLILELKPENQYLRINVFFVFVQDGIVSGIYKVLFVKWHNFPYNYAFGNDTCSAMRAICSCVTGCKGVRQVTRCFAMPAKNKCNRLQSFTYGVIGNKLKLIRYID